MSVDIIQGECRQVLAGLPACSVHTCITSPPYYGLRQYGGGAQEIGAEQTPQEYVAHLVEVFRAVHRVLRDDGTCWIVIGDSFASAWPCSRRSVIGQGSLADGKRGARQPRMGDGLKDKDLMMIPHRVALALQADGWYVRQELVWSKPAPMPESVTDRCTRSHEFIFMLAKQERYYYDATAIAESATAPPGRLSWEERKGRGEALRRGRAPTPMCHSGGFSQAATRNKRSVWSVNTQPLGEEHYAAFPEALITPMILAGTSEAGCCPRCAAPWRRVVERTGHVNQREAAHQPGNTPTKTDSTGWAPVTRATDQWQAGCSCDAGPPLGCTTLDPFLGSGTVALVSKRLGRSCVGIELNLSYCDLARRRVESVPYTLFSAASRATTGAAR